MIITRSYFTIVITSCLKNATIGDRFTSKFEELLLLQLQNVSFNFLQLKQQIICLTHLKFDFSS